MQELAYRIRSAEPEDLTALRDVATVSSTHPEGRGRRSLSKISQQRDELLLLERSDPRAKDWVVGGYIEFHMRVDDVLTIKDVGSVGEAPHAGIVKHLVDELLRSLAPLGATCVVRRDADAWNELLGSITGFFVEGPPEYRRPHYYNIWKWSPELARQAERQARRGMRPSSGFRR